MGAADDAQRPSTNDDDAAVVSPVVLAQRKRRASAAKAPAVTPHDGAASFFDGKRNNSLEDLRKQLRQRPARAPDGGFGESVIMEAHTPAQATAERLYYPLAAR